MNIWLDMDGTFVSLYEVEGWLDDLINYRVRPYEIAKPLVNLSSLARVLNHLIRQGHSINIVSWLSKNSNSVYDAQVKEAKLAWIKKHLPSVNFNQIIILPYGPPKYTVGEGILFDDELTNRINWHGMAYDAKDLIETLKKLVH